MSDDEPDEPVIFSTGDTERERRVTAELMGLEVDNNGYVCDRDTLTRIICPYTDKPVHVDCMAIAPVDEGGQTMDGTALVFQDTTYGWMSYMAEHYLLNDDDGDDK